jgi:hypothetical protein
LFESLANVAADDGETASASVSSAAAAERFGADEDGFAVDDIRGGAKKGEVDEEARNAAGAVNAQTQQRAMCQKQTGSK